MTDKNFEIGQVYSSKHTKTYYTDAEFESFSQVLDTLVKMDTTNLEITKTSKFGDFIGEINTKPLNRNTCLKNLKYVNIIIKPKTKRKGTKLPN